jgi:uncharacterized protein
MTLTGNVQRFAQLLRERFGFRIGQAEVHDALRAIEVAGLRDPARFRAALRAVLCSGRDEIPPFERAFDAFFFGPRGVQQSNYLPRDTRPRAADETGAPAEAERPRDVITDEEPDEAQSWEGRLARYSAAASQAPVPAIPDGGMAAMFVAVRRLLAAVRLGRSRRWRPLRNGPRFDLRRTLRASLHTGGDPVTVRRLGHPRRNPRFVVLIDGSRSMTGYGALALQFAYALCRRTARAEAYVFSTALRRITRELQRSARAHDRRLRGLGESWGGGTRIGANLARFVRRYEATLVSRDTVTIVVSDGFDTGETGQLVRALRRIRRRSAMVVWINPHAADPGYRPEARGMVAALPYIDRLVAAGDARAFGRLIDGPALSVT